MMNVGPVSGVWDSRDTKGWVTVHHARAKPRRRFVPVQANVVLWKDKLLVVGGTWDVDLPAKKVVQSLEMRDLVKKVASIGHNGNQITVYEWLDNDFEALVLPSTAEVRWLTPRLLRDCKTRLERIAAVYRWSTSDPYKVPARLQAFFV